MSLIRIVYEPEGMGPKISRQAMVGEIFPVTVKEVPEKNLTVLLKPDSDRIAAGYMVDMETVIIRLREKNRQAGEALAEMVNRMVPGWQNLPGMWYFFNEDCCERVATH